MKITYFKNIKKRDESNIYDIVNVINTIKKTDNTVAKNTEEYREFIKTTNEKKALSDKKSNLFPGVIFSGEFGGSAKDSDIKKLSGLIVLDIDHVSESFDYDDINHLREILISDDLVYLCFVSPSNDGLKLVIKHDLEDPKKWKELFSQVSTDFFRKYNVDIDQSGSNISRLCYICHDPYLYINEDSKTFEFLDIEEEVNKISGETPYKKTEITDELYNECFYKSIFLKENNINITDDYDDWLSIGFSLAKFGEDGRKIFHNISSVSDKYDATECDTKYDNFLVEFDGEKSGIEKYINITGMKAQEIIKKQLESDSILPNKEFYEKLPDTIKKPLIFNNNIKVKFMGLLSIIGYVSGILPNYRMYHFDRWYQPNLFVWISTKFSGGKNIVNRLGKLLKPIEERIEKERKREYAMYKDREAKALQSNEPFTEPRPKFKSLYIGDDVTKAAFIRKLQSNAGRTIIKSTEASTLIGSNKSKFGNFIDLLLKGFEHERIEKDLNDDKFIVEHPCISLILGSTEDVLYDFFTSDNYDNGLFSRFFSFLISDSDSDTYSSSNIGSNLDRFQDTVIETKAQLLYNLNRELLRHEDNPIELVLNDEQEAKFDEFFDTFLKELKYVYNMDGRLVYRIAVIFKRILMVLSMVRFYDYHGSFNPLANLNYKLKAYDVDFELTKEIMSLYKISFIKVMDGIRKKQLAKTPAYKRDDMITTMYFDGEKLHKISEYFDLPIKKVQAIVQKNTKTGMKRFANDEFIAVLNKTFSVDTKTISDYLKIPVRTIQHIIKNNAVPEKATEKSEEPKEKVIENFANNDQKTKVKNKFAENLKNLE